jgi:hypothetical protein
MWRNVDLPKEMENYGQHLMIAHTAMKESMMRPEWRENQNMGRTYRKGGLVGCARHESLREVCVPFARRACA